MDDPNVLDEGVKEGLDLTDEADTFLNDYADQVEQRGSKLVRGSGRRGRGIVV